MNEELISVRTLARVLDCSPKTVRDWMYKDRRTPAADPLPYYRLGGLVRFRLSEVAAWVDRRRQRVSPLAVGAPSRHRYKTDEGTGSKFVKLPSS
jgi:excisionase family DNA binding protein